MHGQSGRTYRLSCVCVCVGGGGVYYYNRVPSDKFLFKSVLNSDKIEMSCQMSSLYILIIIIIILVFIKIMDTTNG